jgi:hypothetical protein
LRGTLAGSGASRETTAPPLAALISASPSAVGGDGHSRSSWQDTATAPVRLTRDTRTTVEPALAC